VTRLRLRYSGQAADQPGEQTLAPSLVSDRGIGRVDLLRWWRSIVLAKTGGIRSKTRQVKQFIPSSCQLTVQVRRIQLKDMIVVVEEIERGVRSGEKELHAHSLEFLRSF
jgi:hypothetical protein